MNLEDKKIYFILSPHINYYHSYRGDSIGPSGFGKDIKIMADIINELDILEDEGFCNGKLRISWDYGDIFWSIQLQKEYQQNVLDKVIERCKKGKDEVLIGAWGNVAKPILDTEEFYLDHQWFLENSMGIGAKQLFPDRVAPYARTQETMFTNGMIEHYNQLGVEAIGLYYSVVPFDVGRPFMNPRLTLNQQFGLNKLRSSVSDASMLMIPMISFGDIYDHLSIKRWFRKIRRYQELEKISGHALLFLNFDMDYEGWVNMGLPKFLDWMPNTRGLREFAEAVDEYDYVEFANLLDIIPIFKKDIRGEVILRPDVADGVFNGFYNWAQKFENTHFWTIGERARWMKCISDTLVSNKLVSNASSEINKYLREGNDANQTYIRNKILFASTTNYGLAMPFLHPHRHKTALIYALRAYNASEKAAELSTKLAIENIIKEANINEYLLVIMPIINRGISKNEQISIKSPIYINTEIPLALERLIKDEGKVLELKCIPSSPSFDSKPIYSIYENTRDSRLYLEAFFPKSYFDNNILIASLNLKPLEASLSIKPDSLFASTKLLQNQFITVEFNNKGKIISFKFDNEEFSCPNFLDSAVIFGKPGKRKRFSSQKDKIIVLRDGSDGFSASIRINTEFEIIKDKYVRCEKILTIYSGIKQLFVKVAIAYPDIKSQVTDKIISDFVLNKYENKWYEVMPCEIQPNIIGENIPLRIWKRNFMGYVSYFDLDMKRVDRKNKNIDCLVSNISDGWMALSNKKKGILIGFNSLIAANFAFSPIKIRDKGFKDIKRKGQQIRINPFGTYYGKMLHHWTDGTGHAQELVKDTFTSYRSTAPTYNGKTLNFELILAPYLGDEPPEEIQSSANHFSLPPLILMRKKHEKEIFNNYSKYRQVAERLLDELGIREIINMPYIEWVKIINENYDPSKEVSDELDISAFRKKVLIRLLIDGIRGRK
ncbi:MAG: hypothetical protein EU532_06965 [Promethearchaeota archaeon]|nr:MAG: hypothetical protein EU532_06965 [Candidatus Lokiarchaeota archaeon]